MRILRSFLAQNANKLNVQKLVWTWNLGFIGFRELLLAACGARPPQKKVAPLVVSANAWRPAAKLLGRVSAKVMTPVKVGSRV